MGANKPPASTVMNTPHIVKFSGGRSSGMMLMELLKQKALKPERGDVVVFNNTAAEHPATYEFTRKMKALVEKKHNIPFFWIEYQTYEDAGRRGWARNPSYRLVNEQPYSSKNKTGYRFKGEPYEELISLTGYLPNMQSRTCTQALKIFTTNSFLSDWLAQKEGINRQGHHGDSAKMSNEDVLETHRFHRGDTPDGILLRKREFVRNSNFVRESALWKNFTDATLCFDNDTIKESIIGEQAQLFGKHAITFVSCLGIRKDEEIRVEKIKARIEKVTNGNACSLFNQPPLEKIASPLVDKNISQKDVITFWKKQSFNLNLPDTGIFSNCVYCPLKGKAKLMKLAAQEISKGRINGTTPSSIGWWVRMEAKYNRNLKAEKRNITSASEKNIAYVGFFGATDRLVYRDIREESRKMVKKINSVPIKKIRAEFLENESYIPCNCTD